MNTRLHQTDHQENTSSPNWNDTECRIDLCVHEIFESQVGQTPDAIALVQGNASVSYRELNRRANQLCRRLHRLGVRDGEIVCICMERSIELVVVLLGVLKAGAAYLPLGPENPDQRLKFMIEDTGASLIIASDELASRFAGMGIEPKSSKPADSSAPQVMSSTLIWEDIECEGDDDGVERTGSEKPAYVMYTSGTTGEPKGIEVLHRGIVRLVKGVDYVRLDGEQVFLQYAPISFDASTFEIWGCLLNGGRLVLPPAKQTTLEELGEIVARCQITTLWLTAGLFHAMVDERLEDLLKLRQLLAGGDVLSVRHARRLLESNDGPILINGYGPTEGTTFTCCNPIRKACEIDGSVSIGRPISNTHVYVLDDELDQVPADLPGQLYIGGEGLANAYVRRPGLTAAKFLPNPHGGKRGSRMYQTGDRVRLQADGRIEFLGRFDNQVKIRGFRVEIGEIEAVLHRHPKVTECVVVPREDSISQKQLIAFAVGQAESPPTPQELKEFMREQLPEYMMPASIVMLERLPLTANGKVDRKGLLEAERLHVKGWIETRTPIEEMMAAIWRDILHLDRVGMNDDFFDLGGDSLSATRLISRVHKALNVKMSVRNVFECPTIAALAREIEVSRRTGQDVAAGHVGVAPPGRPMPLSFAQERVLESERLHAKEWIEPRTPIEDMMAAIWRDILHLDRVGMSDDFFDLGGDSLSATRLISRVHKALNVKMSVRNVFECPTIAALAREIEMSRGTGPVVAAVPVGVAPPGRPMPLSFAQERMWFLDQSEPGNIAYNVPIAIRIEGEFNEIAMEQSICEIVRRHEVLRTTFVEVDGEPIQRIEPVNGSVIKTIDLRGFTSGEDNEAALELVRTETRKAFDLVKGPLLRATLVRVGEKQNLLLLVMHHIVIDGWSVGVLFRELKMNYASIAGGKPAAARDLKIQYGDFARWQREWMKGDVLKTQIEYWRAQLHGAREEIRLPIDHERPPVRTFRGGAEEFKLPKELSTGLRVMSGRERVSLFMTLLAGFKVLLNRYSGETDVVVGTPIANRNREELEELIGFFVNTLALRSDLSGRPSFKELLERISQVALEAYAHQDLPFEKLVKELGPKRRLNVTPLFQVMFVLHNTPTCDLALGAAKVSTILAETGTTQFDVILSMEETGDDLVGTFRYNLDLFEQHSICRLRDHFITLLSSAVEQPQQSITDLPILTQQEYRQMVYEWNHTDRTYDSPFLIHCLFEEQAEKTPDAIALACAGALVTYDDLNRRANRLAHRLRKLGAAPEVRLAICAERGIDLVVGLLGILKSGASYVPLDPEYPRQRLAYMLEDSRAEMVIAAQTTESLIRGLGVQVVSLDDHAGETADEGDQNPACQLTPTNLAYLIYTSGSTGTPKAVMISHGAAGNHLAYRQMRYPLCSEDRFLHKASFAFDISVWEIFGTLITGAQLIIASKDEYRDPVSLVELSRNQRVTVMHSSPMLLDALLQEGLGACESVRQVFCGGELLSVDLQRRFFGQSKARLTNQYGPTETTIDVTFWECDPSIDLRAVPIGRPIANTRTYVLSEDLQPAPIGVTGELCVSGEPLARGYLGRPHATARSFIPHPFSTIPGARLYRTGDQVCFRSSGEIQFVGRTDNQVKIRGFRVEIGEIEAILNAHPRVRDGVVVAREDSEGQKRLIAYAVGLPETVPTATELKEFIREKLPEYMVPAAIVILGHLPLTASGKVDRKALPEAETEEQEKEWIGPRTQTEELLALIWAEMLKVNQVGMRDRFFDLGGHSLLASRMVSRIRSTFGVDLPLRGIFEEPTVELLARRVDQERRAGRTPTPPITRVSRAGSLPLSFAQQRLWFLDQLDPGSTAYNIPLAFEIDGPVDERALEWAFGEIIRRHEVLRTVFQLVNELPAQLIRSPEPFELPTIDLRALPKRVREEELSRVVAWESRTRFDLSRGPLIRARLIRYEDLRFVLLINMHHAVSDGWSIDVIWKELEDLYSAFASRREPGLPELPIQYADYAVWQREYLQGRVLEEQIEYWRAQLKDLVQIDLPADKPRELALNTGGEAEELTLSCDLTAGIKTMGARHGATTFMILLAALKILLYRWTGQHDVAVGSPIAGRSQAETEDLIGFFVNTIVLRTNLSGDPRFSEVIRRVREVALDAYSHQEIPFEKLVEELQPERDLHRSPFFQVFFNMLGADRPGIILPGVSARPRPLPTHESKFDLSLYAVEDGGRIVLTLVYNADLFLRERIADLLRQLEFVLMQVVEDPERPIKELSLVTPAARELLPDPGKTLERAWLGAVHDRVREHARYRPDAIAIADPLVRLTYRELDLASNRIADLLMSGGIGRGDVVAVLGRRCAPLVVALVGVMKAGAAFLVLDPAYPDQRLIAQLEVAKPREWLVTGGEVPARLNESLRRLSPGRGVLIDSSCVIEPGNQVLADSLDPSDVQIDGESPAYVAFTSGSTGVAKAILGTHAPLSHFLDWHRRTFALNDTDRFCLLSGLSHDPLLRDIFTPLWIGATLCIPDPDDIGSVRLSEWMRREAITVAHLTPALAASLFEGEQDPLQELRYAFFGGDVLTSRTLINFRRLAPFARFANFYGTTETPQAMSYFVVDDFESLPERVPLGRGIEDAQLLVSNEFGKLAGIGELGEISVRTPYLTVGYINDPELTAARYLANPLTGRDGDQVYKTGDFGRYLPDGNVEFVGRSDDQVKIRGFRIELQEVSLVLQTHTGVRDCAIAQKEYAAGDIRLVAYVVPVDRPPSARDLRNYLSGRLPGHMIPSYFVMLDRLPLTPNGKLDRRSLPAPGQAEGGDGSMLDPRTITEELISAIWSQVLQVERIGVNDNFFEMGGHSLLAMQVNLRVCETFHQDVPLRDLFTYPTIRELAKRLDDLRSGSAQQENPITRIRRDGHLPFSFNEGAHLFADWYATTIRHKSKLPFHLNVGLDIKGPLNVPALEDALNEIIRRHEILRTAFHITADGSARTVSRILRMNPREIGMRLFRRSIRSRAPLRIVIVSIENLSATERDALVEREVGRAFDYREPPMLRALVFKTAAREYRLTLLLHHIAFDGWSVHILRKELVSLYEEFSKGEPSSMDEPPFQYVDFAEWQNRKLEGEFLENTVSYWKKSLSEFGPLDARELGFPTPSVSTPGNAYESLVIDSDLLKTIRSFARTKRITLSMFMLSVLDSLLHLYTSKERIGIWTYFANRTRPGTESMIGWFAHRHFVAMEVISNQKAETVLDTARNLVIDATANSELPYILVQMQMNGQHSRGSFSQDWKTETPTSHEGGNGDFLGSQESHIEFDLMTNTISAYRSGGLVIEPVLVAAGRYQPNLRLYGADQGTRIVLTARYPTDLFYDSTIREVLADFRRVLERFLATPDAPISSFADLIRAPYINPERQFRNEQRASGAKGQPGGC